MSRFNEPCVSYDKISYSKYLRTQYNFSNDVVAYRLAMAVTGSVSRYCTVQYEISWAMGMLTTSFNTCV